VLLYFSMTYYERNLPHWQPDGKAIFLTWRLYGSLPEHVVAEIRKCSQPGRQFARAERFLDRTSFGPLWLGQPRIADGVAKCILRGASELNQYAVLAYVVMPNHVHLLIEPRLPVERITRGIKGVSAQEANRLLGRTGLAFWQGESFDRWVRSAAEGEKICRYIEENPVKAGLVDEAAAWCWSSAEKR